ncbi:Glycosyltransferase involved in cell wall bisynthesis [Rhizobiales bacterium GAS188]|nr:Glycosyltransferase involved in cell wall bisynthesis [Rhizobiales bacterium GAS188]
MRILFATSHPHIPQIAGGAQSTTHELVLELRSRGHVAGVHSGLIGKGWLGFRNRTIMKATGRKAVEDGSLGYPIYRSWFAWQAAAEVSAAFRPQVVVLQSGHPVRMAKAFQDAGVVVVPYFHNVEFDTDLGGDPRELSARCCIANSQFTAAKYKEAFGLDPVVIYPLIKSEDYRTDTDGSSVVFINPHPDKGVDMAIELARRCPEIPFAFVEAWTLEARARAELKDTLRHLPNVKLVPRTRDMRSIYRRARIVLAPSQYQETFGRVAAEAHISGIPVLASRRGGLPEAVGPGGVILDVDEPLDTWVAALERLWTDEPYHRQLSQAALDYARRPELDRDRQLARLLGVLQAATDPLAALVE